MAQSNGWFDVTQYGVELSSEDTQCSGIQNAIAAAKSVGGGNIWFPRGKYSLGSTRALELD
jgi:polygalacturonase